MIETLCQRCYRPLNWRSGPCLCGDCRAELAGQPEADEQESDQ